MLRRLLLSFSLVVVGLIGLWFWQLYHSPRAVNIGENTRRPAVVTPRATPVTTRLDFLTDFDQPYQVRINLLRTMLATECSAPELNKLYSLLEKGPVETGNLENSYVIANDIMGQILNHETDHLRFATRFTALLDDPSQPAVIRDYAVQYLAAWLSPPPDPSSQKVSAKPTPELTAQVLESLVKAVKDPVLAQTSIPGTILMALAGRSRSSNDLDSQAFFPTLKPWLEQALSESSALGLANRVSAIIAAGVLAPAEFRPTFRKIAYQPDGTAPLQLPAIANLGICGEAVDLPQLEQIAATHPTLAYAAGDAVRTLTHRLANETSKISQ